MRFLWRATPRLLSFAAIVWCLSLAVPVGSSPQQTRTKPKSVLTKTAAADSYSAAVPSRSEYVGDAECNHCHQAITESYDETAHHRTSAPADDRTVVGDFKPGENIMATGNPNLTFRMDEKGGQFFETALWGAPDSPSVRSRGEHIDLVIGSGGKGQNYLYWNSDELRQLPVGYSTVLRRWINSPGYRDGTADFDRPIVPRCLECHAGYFASQFPGTDSNLYEKGNSVLGITCERCHGPGRKHVASYTATDATHEPDSRPTIVNPAKLSAERRADICAQCHAGAGVREILPEFSYVPGRPLKNYIDLGPVNPTADVDVHGKQGTLLMRSRCYQAAKTMECSTCHDVHKKEGDLAEMSQRCLTCHKVDPSPAHAALGSSITQNCIDCHMPALASKVVSVNVDGKLMYPRFRTHWIKIYSEAERQ